MGISRRVFLQSVPAAVPFTTLAAGGSDGQVGTIFPTQQPELVEEMVVVSHMNIMRVRELVERHPALAKASWDWGFGDWETALGAASHMGRADIAEVLLAKGAPATLFSAAMLGQLDVVKAVVAARAGIQRTRGPHSITLMQHAVAGGAPARPVVEYLKTLEGSDDRPRNEPLEQADVDRLTGVYVFGVTPADRIEITAVKGQLQIGRPGHYPRTLFRQDALEFCPMGAESVRVKFTPGGEGGVTLAIYDPDVVLTAVKAATAR